MITYITGDTRHFLVSNNDMILNSNQSGSGAMRYFNGCVQVYDGNSWVSLTGTSHISLTADTESLLEWVREKRKQEQLEIGLIEKYPALKSAKGQYEMIKQLCAAEDALEDNQKV